MQDPTPHSLSHTRAGFLECLVLDEAKQGLGFHRPSRVAPWSRRSIAASFPSADVAIVHLRESLHPRATGLCQPSQVPLTDDTVSGAEGY